MPKNLSPPTFNLWHKPWITVERPDGTLDTLSLEQTLLEAHKIHAFYETSPLGVCALHRLCVTVLQDVYHPQRPSDLPPIWKVKKFSPEEIKTFGQKYAERFDLFSQEAPFLQTADLNLKPSKNDNAKPVGYLFQEQTAGTAVTHYNHLYDDEQNLCTICVAKGLLLIPAFASSGGAGIKPSINGVPPIYILPGGENLFQSLAASLTIPGYQPLPSHNQRDVAWWQRPLPVTVGKSDEVLRVGYLHSLLFPARRVRLHPRRLEMPCSRCGRETEWGVCTMVYEMGESRPKNAPFWNDPFAAYRPQKTGKDAPLPIRPVEGRALWREFAAMFLPDEGGEIDAKGIRPAILDQLEVVWREDNQALPYQNDIPLRAIGLRTDMKMKIFEWEEAGFTIPPHLLTDVESAKKIKDGLEFAQACERTLRSTFAQYFGGGGQSERYTTLKQQMSQQYWERLGQHFQHHLTQYTHDANVAALFHTWLDTVLKVAQQTFREAVYALPATGTVPVPSKINRYKNLKRSDIKMIRLREDALDDCAKFLYGYRKKNYPRPQEATS